MELTSFIYTLLTAAVLGLGGLAVKSPKIYQSILQQLYAVLLLLIVITFLFYCGFATSSIMHIKYIDPEKLKESDAAVGYAQTIFFTILGFSIGGLLYLTIMNGLAKMFMNEQNEGEQEEVQINQDEEKHKLTESDK